MGEQEFKLDHVYKHIGKLLWVLMLVMIILISYIFLGNKFSFISQELWFQKSLYHLINEINWGNTLFSTINFSLVFLAWFRIGNNHSKLRFNYMQFFIKENETSIPRVWFIGQVHATIIFGFLLDNLRSLIGWNLIGFVAALTYITIIWIGKDNQAIHLNETRKLAAKFKFSGMNREEEIICREQEIVSLQEKIAEQIRHIEQLRDCS